MSSPKIEIRAIVIERYSRLLLRTYIAMSSDLNILTESNTRYESIIDLRRVFSDFEDFCVDTFSLFADGVLNNISNDGQPGSPVITSDSPVSSSVYCSAIAFLLSTHNSLHNSWSTGQRRTLGYKPSHFNSVSIFDATESPIDSTILLKIILLISSLQEFMG